MNTTLKIVIKCTGFLLTFRLECFLAGLSEANPLRYEIYCSQLRLATNFGITEFVETRLKEVPALTYDILEEHKLHQIMVLMLLCMY